jgi:hypothetical protein
MVNAARCLTAQQKAKSTDSEPSTANQNRPSAGPAAQKRVCGVCMRAVGERKEKEREGREGKGEGAGTG